MKDVEIDSAYQNDFVNVLKFRNLQEAEVSLQKIDMLYRQFLQKGDRKGISYCHRISALGRKRAEAISRNGKVSGEKRMEKAEIARWFTIWNQNPDIFFDWLTLRKGCSEFQALFFGPDP
ncbi:MAG: hypothetical protein HY315_00240 [Acidobacteria bacterium]|nr:hypothetical protein [Acidobacteriota bacterium]